MPWTGVDANQYVVRLQEVLVNPLHGDASNGYWSGTTAPHGTYWAGLERLVGLLFSWTGWSGPLVALVVTIFVSPLAVPLVAQLTRHYTSSRSKALVASVLFYFCLDFLQRPVHPAWSGPLAIGTLLALHNWWQKPIPRTAVVSGFLLGLLPWTSYPWAWTFPWTAGGLLLLLIAVTRSSPLFHKRVRTVGLAIAVALLIASGSFWISYQMLRNPNFPVVADRTEILITHALESPIRSMVILLFTLCAWWCLGWNQQMRERHAPLLAMLVASVVVMNQQLVDGHVFSLSTHYYIYIALAAVLLMVALFEVGRRKPAAIAGIGLSALFLSGSVIDSFRNNSYSELEPPPAKQTQYQYLAPALSVLRREPQQMVLSDPLTNYFLAMYTADDVVFAEHARIVLIPDIEYVERFCLSTAFSSSATEGQQQLLAVLHGQPAVAKEERDQLAAHFQSLLDTSCPEVRADPRPYLDRFNVKTLLWNERLHPDWIIPKDIFIVTTMGTKPSPSGESFRFFGHASP